MKRIIPMTMLFLSLNAFSEFQLTDISEFKGSYQKPEGNGSAASLVFPDFGGNRTQAIKLKVIEKDKGYFFSYGAKEFFYENPPEFLSDVDTFHVNDFNFITKKNTASLEIYAFDSESVDAKAKIRSLTANCIESNTTIKDFTTKLIDACLANSHISFSEVYIEQTSTENGAIKGLSGVMNLFSTEEDLTATDKIDLQNFKLDVSNHRFTLSAKVNIGLQATIKVKGSSIYEVDKKRMKIKINSAKAGFFNITSKVFKALKESESESFVVQKPYIYIIMK